MQAGLFLSGLSIAAICDGAMQGAMQRMANCGVKTFAES